MRKRTYSAFGIGLGMARLAADSQQVIALRLAKLAKGGPAARTEAVRMVSEKISTAQKAGMMMAFGASPQKVMALYRKKVASNRRRLK